MGRYKYDYASWGAALLKSLMPGGKWDKKVTRVQGGRPPCALCAKKLGYHSELGALGDLECKTAGCPIALVYKKAGRPFGCDFGDDFCHAGTNVEEFYIMLSFLYDTYFNQEDCQPYPILRYHELLIISILIVVSPTSNIGTTE